MKFRTLSIIALVALAYGCATVPMEPEQDSDLAKRYDPPGAGKAGVYVYRKDSNIGAALKKDVWIDKQCIGQTAKGVFFYHEVDGDEEHTLSTESEFSPNDLVLYMKSGMLYFVEQYIKLGAFVGGAALKQVDEQEGKTELQALKLAKKGSCS